MSLKNFIEQEKKDPYLFWKLSSGIHQNLLNEAIDEIEKLKSIIKREKNGTGCKRKNKNVKKIES
jgi:hypothetical protein